MPFSSAWSHQANLFTHGDPVGAIVGDSEVGRFVGSLVGNRVGFNVGNTEGERVGPLVGAFTL